MVWNGVRVHFLTKTNVRVIHVLCRHLMNQKVELLFWLISDILYCGREMQHYILFLICDELFNC
jgi:hypothetical protein